jgi:hypothetical protein
MFGVYRVKNHDFTPKNHTFSNFGGGGGAPGAPPGSAPDIYLWTIASFCHYVLSVLRHTFSALWGLWLWCLTPLANFSSLKSSSVC